MFGVKNMFQEMFDWVYIKIAYRSTPSKVDKDGVINYDFTNLTPQDAD